MKALTIVTTLFILTLFFPAFPLKAQNADELLAKMDQLMNAPNDKQGIVEITLIKKSEKEKVREAQMMQKDGKRLYRYTQPENQAGIATLSLPDDVMWLYMPAFGKPKKISLLAKSQAFTGTDFSYEDMEAKTYAERYAPKLLETNADNYMLELTPKDEKSDYSKIVLTQNKQYYYPEKMEYYDKGGDKRKEATYIYQKIGKYWNASEVVMTDLKKDHQTKITMTDVKFDQGLSDDVFSVENLEQPKE
ncbi:MAG: outer membrane lipoprotein-sorting protein [Bacteroidales bacterium]|nr:outer membrane lipoprotein-sorting protein [Bacteroidales bacterium]